MNNPYIRWSIIFLPLVVVLAWNYAIAEPVARSADSTAEIILHNEECKLPKGVIRNLPFRGVWNDRTNSTAYEGCFGIKERQVLMYFEDGSVALLHLGSFIILRGI